MLFKPASKLISTKIYMSQINLIIILVIAYLVVLLGVILFVKWRMRNKTPQAQTEKTGGLNLSLMAKNITKLSKPKPQPVDQLAELERGTAPVDPEPLPVHVVESFKQDKLPALPEVQPSAQPEPQNINSIPGVTFEKPQNLDPIDIIVSKINDLGAKFDSLQSKLDSLEAKSNIGHKLAQARAAKRTKQTSGGVSQ